MGLSKNPIISGVATHNMLQGRTEADGHPISAITGLPDFVGNVLQKNNTNAFTPTGLYNPVTKKYVDDATDTAKEYADTKTSKPIGHIEFLGGSTSPENYIPCDGKQISNINYPELYALMENTGITNNFNETVLSNNTLQFIYYANGYWVTGGNAGYIFYKQDTPDGKWTSKLIAAGLYVNDAFYADGYWVLAGMSGKIYYSTSLDGAFASLTMGSSSFKKVIKANGYWAAVCDGGSTFYYKAGNPDSAWTANALPAATEWVEYANGYWVCVGSSGRLYYQAGIPTGAWTTNTQTGISFTCVKYINGYWLGVGSVGAMKYKQDTPDGTWTDIAPLTLGNLTTICFYNNRIYVGGDRFVIYCNNIPTNTWNIRRIPQSGTLMDVYVENNYIVFTNLFSVLWCGITPTPVFLNGNCNGFIKALP